MQNDDYPLTDQEFKDIYSKVPRLTVEIILRNDKNEVYLTKRAIEPYIGAWHLPGGTVRYAERLTEAVRRVAKRELGLDIGLSEMSQQGYIEYPSYYKHGLGSPVGIVFVIEKFVGDVSLNSESEQGAWFAKIPEAMHGDQDVFLVSKGYISA